VVRVGFIVASMLGVILLVAGIVSLFVGVFQPEFNLISLFGILGAFPLILLGVALLLLGGVYLSFVVCRSFIRICRQSLVLSGLALCSVSVIAGLFWSLGH